MAASVDTAEGGEAQGDPTAHTVDYEAMLSATLERHKVKHIADIVQEVEELSLSDLLAFEHKDVMRMLNEIHEDEDNKHTIRASHCHKFAKAVSAVSDERKKALNEQAVAVAAHTSPQVKLLFLGKEEEEAIETIQSEQKLMTETVANVKRQFNALDANHEAVKAKLMEIGEALKQRIDAKVQEVGSVVDGVYQFHLGALKERADVTRQSAKVVAKFHNDYESYFTDESLTKSDRRDKLVAAMEGVLAEAKKIKKYEDKEYQLQVTLSEDAVTQFLPECMALESIGIALPALEITQQGTCLNWQPPKVDLTAFSKRDGDSKEEDESVIEYKIRYAPGKLSADRKLTVFSAIVLSDKVTEYDMADHAPCTVAVQYTVSGVLCSPMSVFVELGGNSEVEQLAETSSDGAEDEPAIVDVNDDVAEDEPATIKFSKKRKRRRRKKN